MRRYDELVGKAEGKVKTLSDRIENQRQRQEKYRQFMESFKSECRHNKHFGEGESQCKICNFPVI